MAQAKEWFRPQLIRLARAAPEESVLDTCKNGQDGPGKYLHNIVCYYQVGTLCDCCSETALS